MNQFYLTLPSDSSYATFPENSVACFKTKLSERIELEGDYEIGLAELIYPHSWLNFKNNDDGEYYAYLINNDGERTDYTFSSGQYRNEASLFAHFNKEIDNPSIVFTWKPRLRRVKLDIKNNIGVFYMSNALTALLGFQAESYSVGSHISVNLFDLSNNLHLMYIYCDLASHANVGDTKAPLLRVCDTEGEYGQMVRTIFTHPHYYPIARSNFETVEINISSAYGRPMPFEFGKAVVTLHIKRKNKLIL
jgi:hypothetical protein